MSDSGIKRNFYDSVFQAFFSDDGRCAKMVKEVLELPQDVQVEDISRVTLEPALTYDVTNDLGLVAGKNLLFLSEAQSTAPANIALRIVSYYARTLEKLVLSRKDVNIYGEHAYSVPAPVFFTVYTGGKPETVPEVYTLSGHFMKCGDVQTMCEFVVRVLKKSNVCPHSLVWQYICFCEQVRNLREFGYVEGEFYQELMRYCLGYPELYDFMLEHGQEVYGLMTQEERNVQLRERAAAEAARIEREKAWRSREAAIHNLMRYAGISYEAASKVYDGDGVDVCGSSGGAVSKLGW